NLRNYFNDKLYDNAEVILGTPIGLNNFLSDDKCFDVLVMDEAGQCIEPLAWVIFPYADKWIIAGDPFQLPPTVISDDATRKGFNISILERGFKRCEDVYFLDTQYRMRSSIAGFSSDYFYEGNLKTPSKQQDTGSHVVFYDTAGTGYEEERGADGSSLMNSGELSVIQKLLEGDDENYEELAVISPYAGQVQLLTNELPKLKRISTVDSFQGQESTTVIISLVRSNNDGTIGFLKDYRRMNVAMTRAKERLIVIGDSATVGLDPFFSKFLNYVEEMEGYRSAWELIG
ncbi:MAG: DEAD/DEAH box helicase family protein, partial [Crocinitomicaceae bacterium]|nr:DEAD/DEAH box helicase family protein [Crocinitomicaceae bacterium]